MQSTLDEKSCLPCLGCQFCRLLQMLGCLGIPIQPPSLRQRRYRPRATDLSRPSTARLSLLRSAQSLTSARVVFSDPLLGGCSPRFGKPAPGLCPSGAAGRASVPRLARPSSASRPCPPARKVCCRPRTGPSSAAASPASRGPDCPEQGQGGALLWPKIANGFGYASGPTMACCLSFVSFEIFNRNFSAG